MAATQGLELHIVEALRGRDMTHLEIRESAIAAGIVSDDRPGHRAVGEMLDFLRGSRVRFDRESARWRAK
jgi:hypothetical protein